VEDSLPEKDLFTKVLGMPEKSDDKSTEQTEGTVGFVFACQLISIIGKRRVWEKLPSFGQKGSVQFAREVLGMFSYAENVVRMWMLKLYPEKWTPQNSREFSKYWAFTATCPYDQDRCYSLEELLVRPDEKELVLDLNMHEVVAMGGKETFLAKKRDYKDCFGLIQEARNIEVGMLAKKYEPFATFKKEGDYNVSMAFTECYISWCYGSLKTGVNVEDHLTVMKEILEVSVEICMGLKEFDKFNMTVDATNNPVKDDRADKKKRDKIIWEIFQQLKRDVWEDSVLSVVLGKGGREWHYRLGVMHLAENIVALRYRGLNESGSSAVEAWGLMLDAEVRTAFVAIMETCREDVSLAAVSTERERKALEGLGGTVKDKKDTLGVDDRCSVKVAYARLQMLRLHSVKEVCNKMEEKGANYPGSFINALSIVGKEWMSSEWDKEYASQLAEAAMIKTGNICNDVISRNSLNGAAS